MKHLSEFIKRFYKTILYSYQKSGLTYRSIDTYTIKYFVLSYLTYLVGQYETILNTRSVRFAEIA